MVGSFLFCKFKLGNFFSMYLYYFSSECSIPQPRIMSGISVVSNFCLRYFNSTLWENVIIPAIVSVHKIFSNCSNTRAGDYCCTCQLPNKPLNVPVTGKVPELDMCSNLMRCCKLQQLNFRKNCTTALNDSSLMLQSMALPLFSWNPASLHHIFWWYFIVQVFSRCNL